MAQQKDRLSNGEWNEEAGTEERMMTKVEEATSQMWNAHRICRYVGDEVVDPLDWK